MKRIFAFSIPAWGHVNPMLPVVAELVRRGNAVRFYSFDAFKDQIERTGAEFVSCERRLDPIDAKLEARLKRSTTEMTLQAVRITQTLEDYYRGEFERFAPDVVFSDYVCFWGKLNARRYGVPLVESVCTFAFNRYSSQYMKSSAREMFDLIFGLPRVLRALKKLKARGYKFDGLFSLVQVGGDVDAVVYATKGFQPFAETFSERVRFVGPSVFSYPTPKKNPERPLVYVALGTVVNDRPEFYRKCVEAFRRQPFDAIISCGTGVDVARFGDLPSNVEVVPHADQLAVLSRASAFISHCGMNSASESLLMATPMILYPQTNEQRAVARRVAELGAGFELQDESVAGIRSSVHRILRETHYSASAQREREDFLAQPGALGAADCVEGVGGIGG